MKTYTPLEQWRNMVGHYRACIRDHDEMIAELELFPECADDLAEWKRDRAAYAVQLTKAKAKVSELKKAKGTK